MQKTLKCVASFLDKRFEVWRAIYLLATSKTVLCLKQLELEQRDCGRWEVTTLSQPVQRSFFSPQ